MTYPVEDPAVVMARRTLHKAKKEFDKQEQEEMKMQRMIVCLDCGKEVPRKGCKMRTDEEGGRRFICPDCQDPESEPRPVRKEVIAIESPRQARRTCFFCNHDLFFISIDGSIQCATCKSIFFKGPE